MPSKTSESGYVKSFENMSDIEIWDFLKRNIFPLKPSQYDITSICNLNCEGCLFFSGEDYLQHKDKIDENAVEEFFSAEARRGVRYGYFGGAEPSLVENKLATASRHIPFGVIFTNGTRKISEEISYKIHVSVWGLPERSRKLRGAEMLSKQIKNYAGDKRAVFVFTITPQNIEDLPFLGEICADNNLKLSFNHYSPTDKYQAYAAGELKSDKYHNLGNDGQNLIFDGHTLRRAQETISRLMERFPSSVIYSEALNKLINNPSGLYPVVENGVAQECAVKLTSALRHYNTDLTRSSAKCCSPNISCTSCRLYAQSFATILMRATRDMRKDQGLSNLMSYWKTWSSLFLNIEGLNNVAILGRE